MIGNLLAWIAQATLLAVVAALLPAALRLRAPRPRLIFWQATLVLIVLLPILQPWQTVPAPISAVVSALASGPGAPLSAVTEPSGRWLPAILVAGALARLLWLGLGLSALASYRGSARPLTPPVASRSLMARLGISAVFAVSDRVSVPVTFGWRRPTILVPPAFEALGEEVRAAALCHEIVHVARRDARAVFIEELVRAVVWFHPGVWLLLGRIALAREQVVDQQAVALTGDRRSYLEALYQLARGQRSARWQRANALALPFISRGHLLARIRLLTQEITMTTSRVLLSAIAVVAVTASTTLFSTATFPLMAVASAAEGPIYTVGDDVEAPKRLSGDAPVYPEDARKERVVGKVVLRTVIDRSGKVEEIEVTESVDERLSQAASEAVRSWRFSPATKGGTPVDVYFHLTVNFRLDAEKKDR